MVSANGLGTPKPVLGIDLGSYIATTGILVDGPNIQILESNMDRRKTNVALCFPSGKIRTHGSAAIAYLEYDYASTVQFIPRFIDL